MTPAVLQPLPELSGEVWADAAEADFFAGAELAEGFQIGGNDAGEDGIATGGGMLATEELGLAGRGKLDGAVPGAATHEGLLGSGQGEAFEADGHAGGFVTDAVDGAGEKGEGLRGEKVGVRTFDDAQDLDAVYQKRGVPILA